MLDYNELKTKNQALADRYKLCMRLIDEFSVAYTDSLQTYQITRKLTSDERQALIELAFYSKVDEIMGLDYIQYIKKVDGGIEG